MLRENLWIVALMFACQPAQTPPKKESPKTEAPPSLVSKETPPKVEPPKEAPKPATQEAPKEAPKEFVWQKAAFPEVYDVLGIYGAKDALYIVDHADGGFLSKDGKTFEQIEIKAALKSKDNEDGAQNVVYAAQLPGGEIFVCTENGLSGDFNIFASFDNGASFASQESGNIGCAAGITGNATDGYFAVAGSLLTSTDKGKTWQTSSPTKEELRSITMTTAGLFAVGAKGTLITSSDKGKTWTPLNSNTSEDLNFITSHQDELYAVGAKGTIIYSKDGKSFSLESSAATKDLWRAAFVAGDVVATGDEGTIVSKSAGGAWKTENSGVTASLKVMYVIGDVVWVGGKNGILLSRVPK